MATVILRHTKRSYTVILSCHTVITSGHMSHTIGHPGRLGEIASRRTEKTEGTTQHTRDDSRRQNIPGTIQLMIHGPNGQLRSQHSRRK